MEASSHSLLSTIELSLIPGIGPGLQDRLIHAFPDSSEVFHLGYGELKTRGLGPKACGAILTRKYKERSEDILAWVQREGFKILLRTDLLFPPLLEEIYHPPLLLYAAGHLEILKMPSIAIVGTRRPTCYGLQMARGLSYELARRGIAIVSGLARGIDGAVHEGCLESGTGTIAVLGCGIDVTYPREHRRLSKQIRDRGLILSEFPPATPPMAKNFPKRNRILSGLALGCLIIEASEYSGSLITARLALEQNRELFALPGNITSPQSFGPNFLIKQGAKVVQSWRDIIEELSPDLRQNIYDRIDSATQPIAELELLTNEEMSVLELLRIDEALQFDKILLNSSLPTSKLNGLLFGLEMKGFVRQIPGNLFIKVFRPRKSI